MGTMKGLLLSSMVVCWLATSEAQQPNLGWIVPQQEQQESIPEQQESTQGQQESTPEQQNENEVVEPPRSPNSLIPEYPEPKLKNAYDESSSYVLPEEGADYAGGRHEGDRSAESEGEDAGEGSAGEPSKMDDCAQDEEMFGCAKGEDSPGQEGEDSKSPYAPYDDNLSVLLST